MEVLNGKAFTSRVNLPILLQTPRLEQMDGLGSDFDGAHIPYEMKDISDLGILRKVMSDHGYNDNLMNKLCNENWIRVLDKVWK